MYRHAVDYADPSGLDAMPRDCVSATSASLSQTAGGVGCAGRASQVYEQANTNAALRAAPTFRLLSPFRSTFAPAADLLRRSMGLAALTPLVGRVGYEIGLVAAVARDVGTVARGAKGAVDTATLGVSDASPLEGGVAAVHTTIADTQISGDDADDVVDFAHGTTRASATDIMVNGPSYETGLKNMTGSVEPGSFFTIRIDPSNPSEALSTAAFWAKRHDGPLCVLICRLPRSVVGDLEGGGALIHTVGPTQSIFRPASFDVVNRAAAWVVVNFER